MKKLFLIFCISSAFILVASAQHYEKFRVGFGSGFTLKGSDEIAMDGGILFSCEPSYHLTNDLVMGARLQFADTNLDLLYAGYQIGSFALSGQYYFGNSKLRPLVGGGLGWFNVNSLEYPSNLEEAAKFGFYPRVGFDFGHLYLLLEYNFIPPSETIYLDEIKNNYFGVTVGFFAGGGRLASKGAVE